MRDRINTLFDIVDLIVVRILRLVLLVIGAYTLIRRHI